MPIATRGSDLRSLFPRQPKKLLSQLVHLRIRANPGDDFVGQIRGSWITASR